MTETRTCDWCRKSFTIWPEDVEMYQKLNVPYPTLCPDDRARRRFAFRNERKFFYRTSSFSGKNILAAYPNETIFPVYENDIWFSDTWERPWLEYDFNRSLFDQLSQLQNLVPRMALMVTTPSMVNSDYTNTASYLKNCYLLSNSFHDEDCYYGNFIVNARDCVDGLVNVRCEMCYDCIDCYGCYNLQYSRNCRDSRDGYFLENCIGCSDCFLCVNLRRKKYCILNQQYTKEEYEHKLQSFHLGQYSLIQAFKRQFQDFCKSAPHPAWYGLHNENCLGNHLHNCKNARYCFDCVDLEDCHYCIRVHSAKDCMDYYAYGENAELLYECVSAGGGSYDLLFCASCWMNTSHLRYCNLCLGCNNCFGCVGLYKKEYCILNKQYTQAEYKEIIPRIIEQMRKNNEWGEFFPLSLSAYPYNHTIAQDFYPSTKETILQLGGKWVEEEHTVSAIVPPTIPDDIADVQDDILQKTLVCEKSGKPYKLTAQELKFYREHNIPVPRQCFDERHLERLSQRLPRKLFTNKCAKTGKEIITSFAPDSGYIVYDRKVFDQEFA